MLAAALLVAVLATQPADPLAGANQAFARKDWATAAAQYEAVVKAHPEQASSWARLGRSLREDLGKAREALTACRRRSSWGSSRR